MSLQVEVLEKSFDEIKPVANEFVTSFYDNLFTAHPEAKPLFETTDMEAQKNKLLNSLVLVVDNLRNPDALNGALRGLGARHVKYGALPEHYPLVGGALLTTFEQYLGDKWTPNTKDAWVGAYGAISEIMLDGADYSEAEIALPTNEAEPELDVELLEQSFNEVKPVANEFVASFYDNLFTAHPEAKPLFETTNMEAQKKKLLDSLVLVVENLRKPNILDKALRGLGARHVKYGALPEHYPLVGGALLTTFEQYLRDKWTPEVKNAWVGAYGAISEIMLDGADYSQAEISLPTPAPTLKDTASRKGALPRRMQDTPSDKPEPIAASYSNNTQMATAELQPLASIQSNGAGMTAESSEFTHDSGKATMAAFAGGGIMAIVATILVFLL